MLCNGDGYGLKKEASLHSICLQFIGRDNCSYIKMITNSRGISSVLLIVPANSSANYNTGVFAGK